MIGMKKRGGTMKNLNRIQNLASLGKILSKLVFVCALVGACLCLAGLVSLPFADSGILKLGGVTLYGRIVNRGGASLGTVCAALSAGLVFSAGEVVLARFAHRYFVHEMEAGTPFTQEGAAELQKLGIYTICIPLGTQLLAQILYAVQAEVLEGVGTLSMDGFVSVELGAAFLVMSLIFRYGAQVAGEQT